MARRTLVIILLLIPAFAMAGRHESPGKEGMNYGVFSGAIVPDGDESSGFKAPAERSEKGPTPPGTMVKLPPDPRCYTDVELMAEVALRFVFLQESAARTCDPALKLRDRRAERLMTRMNDEIVEKFAFNLEKYQRDHVARYQRWYGKHWERALEIERRRTQQKFLKDLWLLPGSCANMRKELEIILNSGWHYLTSKFNFEATAQRPSSRMCKVGG